MPMLLLEAKLTRRIRFCDSVWKTRVFPIIESVPNHLSFANYQASDEANISQGTFT
jgi:hypothetical protein